MKSPVVALAQIKYFDVHKDNNVEKIKRYIRLAKKKGADIVCFPESVIHRTETLHPDHEFILEIREECKKNSIWCIINDDIKLKGVPYNMALLINRQGKIVENFKKINLYGDSDEVKPGKEVKVIKTEFGKIGIIICWDLAFPELFKQMKKLGAEIVFCPAAWCYELKAYDKDHKKQEEHLLRSLVKTRAFENLFFVCLCNPVRERKDQVSYSAICSPHKILKEISEKEGMIVAKLNFNELKKFKKIYSHSNIRY
ncbi:carbon-nitrogen hydrolase family protein [Candidatus Pacearchaeota archaeon]|nr:carbon-nitrogen hydrolase family protein [Candidatus Pacearchaeota archaeon]